MTLRISETDGSWRGTFAITVGFMIDDLLSDGEPIRVRYSLGYAGGLSAVVTKRDGMELVLASGLRVDVDDLDWIEVP